MRRKKPMGAELADLLEKIRNASPAERENIAHEYGFKNANSMKACLGEKRHGEGYSTAWTVRQREAIADSVPSYQELINLAKDTSRLHRRMTHRGEYIKVNLKTQTPIALTFTADWHLGNVGVDYEQFDKDLNIIANTPNLYAYVGGDSIQNWQWAGATGSEQFPIPLQRALLMRSLEVLGPKVLAVGTGNHNDWAKAVGIDDMAEIADRLNLIYTQNGGLLELKVGKVTYNIFRVHKARFNSSFNLTHCIKRLWEFADEEWDIGIAEHGHLAAIEPFYRHDKERWAMRTGSYLIKDSFARSNAVYGVRPENPTIVLYPDTRRIVGFLHMQDAIDYLTNLPSG